MKLVIIDDLGDAIYIEKDAEAILMESEIAREVYLWPCGHCGMVTVNPVENAAGEIVCKECAKADNE